MHTTNTHHKTLCTPATCTSTSQRKTLSPTTSQLPHNTTHPSTHQHGISYGSTQCCSHHSLPLVRQPLPAMPGSYESSQHTQPTPMCHTDSALLLHSTASTYKTSQPCMPHSIATKLQPPTTQPTLHTQQHALHTQFCSFHSNPSLRQPFCAHK